MTELVVQTALEPYDRPPSADQLPDGWFVAGWRVSRYADWDRTAIHVECDFRHVNGTTADFSLKFHKTIDYSWVRRFLEVAQDIPPQVSARTDCSRFYWP